MYRPSTLHRISLLGLAASLVLAFGSTPILVAQDTMPALPTPPITQVSATSTQPLPERAPERPTELPTPQVMPAPAAAPLAYEPASSCSSCGRGGGCSSCGGGGGYGGPGCGCVAYPCGYNGCFPGHQNCCGSCGGGCGSCGEAWGPIGKFLCCFHSCLCCPDPCYEPCYRPEANSAFFVDGARPLTITRFRYDAGFDFAQPDRNEFFWARSGGGGKGPKKIDTGIRYDTFSLYQEVATAKASFFIETPYMGVDPQVNPHASGFGDMNLGTKALLFDCELIQISFQFRTYLPVGNFGKGLGTGHVSLEPSLLTTVKLLPETYFQAQISEWIPIAGDPAYAGSVLHYHFAVNHVLYRCMPDVPLIGSIELNGYSFQDGQFSDPINGQFQMSSGETWVTAGPSLRLSICNRLDFGLAAQFAFEGGPAQQLYRGEMRLRF